MKFKNYFKGLCVATAAIFAFAACESTDEVMPELKVTPSENITFKASDNEPVTLEVMTNQDSWSVGKTPEWLNVKTTESSLILTVNDNETEDLRLGRIVISAERALPVKIAIVQEGKVNETPVDPEKPEVDGVAAKVLLDASTIYMSKQEGKATIKLHAELEEEATEESVITLSYDAARLEEYEFLTGNTYELFPEAGVSLKDVKLIVAKGEKVSEDVEIEVVSKDLDFGTGYLVPLVAKSEQVAFTTKTRNVDVIVMLKNNRSMKNVLYFEVNDTNPLNALEYKLEDGSNFFDAVVLFAANINYNSLEDVVYLHNNPNVQALLDESEVYLQPLRKAGIKVYLGLLGNHDAAGLAQLSDWGAQQWAKEVAEACKEYQLDGVNLDDEYSGYPEPGNKWFANRSSRQAAVLCYELKQALKKECYWPTEVSTFEFGSMYLPENITLNEETIDITKYLDFCVANYGGATKPRGHMTYANCSAGSYELNRGYGAPSEANVKAWKEKGYGWLMWFALDPNPESGIYNGPRSLPKLQNAARGMFDQELLAPKGYYKKPGEGKYDPKRYEF